MRALAPSLAIAILIAAGCGGPQTATRQVRSADGNLQWEYQSQEGRPHGVSRTFHPNGELASYGHYRLGAKHGLFKYFGVEGDQIRQALYRNGDEVWYATDPKATPPPMLEEIVTSSPDPTLETLIGEDPVPRPYFSSTDRTTSLTRAGLQLGFSGDSDRVGFGDSRRAELFANHRVGHYGGYAQLAGSSLELSSGEQSDGRRTLELGATYHRSWLDGTLTPRVGLVVPVGANSPAGWLPAANSAFQRPTDAAAAATSTVTLRTGSSWTRSLTRIALQADTGLDWILGDAEAPFDALARANAAAGFGSRRAMVSLELSNTVRLRDPSQRIHSLGLGATVWVQRIWLAVFVSRATESRTAITASVGYGL